MHLFQTCFPISHRIGFVVHLVIRFIAGYPDNLGSMGGHIVVHVYKIAGCARAAQLKVTCADLIIEYAGFHGLQLHFHAYFLPHGLQHLGNIVVQGAGIVAIGQLQGIAFAVASLGQ